MASVQRNHMDTKEPETLLQGTLGNKKNAFHFGVIFAWTWVSIAYLGCHGVGRSEVGSLLPRKLANQDFHQQKPSSHFFLGVRLDFNLFIPQEVWFNIKIMIFLFHKSLMVGLLNHCLRMFELNRTSPKPSSAAK